MKAKSATAETVAAAETVDAVETAATAEAAEVTETTTTADPQVSKVGFRRPPRHANFKKGQSGNPGGRPRRPRDGDLVALLCAALDAPTTIVEEGKRRRGTKRELIAAQLVDRSTQADLRATKLLVDLVQKIAPRLPEAEPLDAADEKVIATILARLGMAE
jgi:Family of unknown function (DUF5681)